MRPNIFYIILIVLNMSYYCAVEQCLSEKGNDMLIQKGHLMLLPFNYLLW